MIYGVRTANIQGGKIGEAFEFAVKMAAYLNEKFPDIGVQVLRNTPGPVYQLHWVARYESLAAFEDIWAQMSADPGYLELYAAGVGLFDASSMVDRWYQTVP